MYSPFPWGIPAIDRTGFRRFIPKENRGTAIFDENFDVAPSTTQHFMLEACDRMRTEPCASSGCSGGNTLFFDENDDDVRCTLELFHEWHNATWPSDNVFTLGDVDPDEFYDRMRNWTFTYDPDMNRANQIGFSKNAPYNILFMTVLSRATLLQDQPVLVKKPVLDELEVFVASLNEQAPVGLKTAFASSFDAFWIETELGIVRGLFYGLAVSLPTAFVVVTLATSNVIIGSLALLTIAGIVSSVLGLAYLLGWALGIGEAIAGVFVVGLSVDFTLHIGGVWSTGVESGLTTRGELFEFSAITMGGTIVAAAATTMLAGAALFFTQLAFFGTMATLIIASQAFSLWFTFAFFLPMLYVAGPIHAGDIRCGRGRGEGIVEDKSDGLNAA